MPPVPKVPKVSVILPVFKAHDYIANTIALLQRQTLRELEFIFVDDLGNDGCADIIGQAARSDPRIRLLRNSVNSGAGPSRNFGLAHAKGEYVAFMDADDWVDDNFYERLYDIAHPRHLDFAKGTRIRHEEDGSSAPSPLNDRIRNGIADGLPMYRLFTFEHTTAIFSLAFLQATDASYGASRHDQDTTFLLRALYTPPNAPPPFFVITDDVAYHYRQLPSSLIHSIADSFFSEHVKSFREKIDFLVPRAVDDPSVYAYAARWFATMLHRCYAKIQNDRDRTACKIDFLTGLLDTVHRLPDVPLFIAQPMLERFAPFFDIPWPLTAADRAALPGRMDACLRISLLRRLFRALAPRPLRRLFKSALHN